MKARPVGRPDVNPDVPHIMLHIMELGLFYQMKPTP